MAEEKKTTTKPAAAKTAAAKTAGTKSASTAKPAAAKTAAAKTTASKTTAAKTTAAKASGTKTTAAKASGTKTTAAKRTTTAKTTASRTSKPKAAPVEETKTVAAAEEGLEVTAPVVSAEAVAAAEAPVVPAVEQSEQVADQPQAENQTTQAENALAQENTAEDAPAEENAASPAKEKGKAWRITRKVLGYTGWGFLGLLVIMAIWLAVDKLILKSTIPQAYGVSMLEVSTGSMEGDRKDSFDEGDVIFIWRHPNTNKLKKGDIITYWEDRDKDGKLDPTPTTHRIHEVNADGTFTTWGDANNAADGTPVLAKNVIGQYMFHIPKAGHFMNWISTGGGALYLVAFGVIIVLIIYVAKKKEV